MTTDKNKDPGLIRALYDPANPSAVAAVAIADGLSLLKGPEEIHQIKATKHHTSRRKGEGLDWSVRIFNAQGDLIGTNVSAEQEELDVAAGRRQPRGTS